MDDYKKAIEVCDELSKLNKIYFNKAPYECYHEFSETCFKLVEQDQPWFTEKKISRCDLIKVYDYTFR